MITGAHSIIYSSDPETDRNFFEKILKFPHVDIGHGWLIFGLPPSEVAIHPSDKSGTSEFYLMCEDVKLFIQEMKKHNIKCSAVDEQRWGLITYVTLPGGGKLGVYESKHASPKSIKPKARSVKPKVRRK